MQKIVTRIVDNQSIRAFEEEVNKLLAEGKWRLMTLTATAPAPALAPPGLSDYVQTLSHSEPWHPHTVLVAVLEDTEQAQKLFLDRVTKLRDRQRQDGPEGFPGPHKGPGPSAGQPRGSD